MSCDCPIQAYRSDKVNAETGKRPLVFKVNEAFSGLRLLIPCGRCAGCRLERSRQWAVRIMHENKMHKQSCFVTLTYDNESLPDVGTLVPSHLQGFHKRLHNRLLYDRGYGIRYYGCGEYGDLNRRPHYHSILFGFEPDDKKFYSGNGRGDEIYSSAFLDDVWGHGAVKLGRVTFESAAYVARYCMKKVDGEKREAGHYQVYDADGVIHERVPEFPHMSRRPGIGAGYFDKYGKEIMTHDSVIMNSREAPSVRFYDMKIEAIDPDRLKEIKSKRLRLAAKSARVDRDAERAGGPRMVSRRMTKSRLRDLKLKQKERSL